MGRPPLSIDSRLKQRPSVPALYTLAMRGYIVRSVGDGPGYVVSADCSSLGGGRQDRHQSRAVTPQLVDLIERSAMLAVIRNKRLDGPALACFVAVPFGGTLELSSPSSQLLKRIWTFASARSSRNHPLLLC